MSENQDQNLSSMITSVVEDLNALVRGHIELAKAEARDGVSRVITASVLFISALAMANLAVIFVFIAFAFFLNNQGFPLWVSFLVVMLALLVGAGIMVAIAVNVLKKMTFGTRTADSFNETAKSLGNLRDSSK